MKRKVIFSAMLVILLALGLALVGCSTDDPPGSGGIDWRKTYDDDGDSITFTGTSISGEYTIPDVSIGESRTIDDDGDSITWAYVYRGSTKIGIIFCSTWVWSSNYSETSYYLYLGKSRWENSGGADQSDIRDDGCDVSDMSDDYSFRGSYDED
jgi:hypothetical protein